MTEIHDSHQHAHRLVPEGSQRMITRAVRRLFACSVPQRGRANRALGLALLISAIALTGAGVVNPPTAVGQDDGNPGLALFGEMMPVFTSPRCSNCHGGVDPVSGANHEPGPVADSTRLSNGDMGFDERGVCQECHTAGTANWRVAPRDFAFVGRDALTLCRQIRRNSGLAGGDADAGGFFVNHIANDDLIGVGFAGQGGIGEDSPFATITPDPPPMSRSEMVAAAQRWVGEGHASCGANGWNGTITSTTTAMNHEDRQPGVCSRSRRRIPCGRSALREAGLCGRLTVAGVIRGRCSNVHAWGRQAYCARTVHLRLSDRLVVVCAGLAAAVLAQPVGAT
jgi:hypothetical protein